MGGLNPDEVESRALRDAVRGLLADMSTHADVRAAMESDLGFDPELWGALAEMGVTGIVTPAVHGGAGLGPEQLEGVMEEVGASLLCSPLFGSSVLAAAVLDATRDADACERVLPGLADGSTIAAACLTGVGGDWTSASVDVVARDTDGTALLDGTSDFVIHGQNADVFLVVARTGDGFGLFEVDPMSEGVSVVAQPCLDRTQRLARVGFTRVSAARLGERGWDAVEEALDIARVALVGDQAGGAAFLFDMTVDYIRGRYQFGRPVGGFQALKHMAADLLLEKESALSAARCAAASLAAGSSTARADVYLASFACADAYSRIAADSVQMHGGIAYTAEYPAHLYLRRARVTAWMLGGPSTYRERYLAELGG
ncbi:MAG: acyl-CoA dehydrogenase family protein [Acidimicrobiales bacterium]